jgi:hypothetical protein
MQAQYNGSVPEGYVRPTDPKKVERYRSFARELEGIAGTINGMVEAADGYRQVFDGLRDWRATARDLDSSSAGLSWGLWHTNKLAELGRIRDLMLEFAKVQREATQVWNGLTEDEREGLRRPWAY